MPPVSWPSEIPGEIARRDMNRTGSAASVMSILDWVRGFICFEKSRRFQSRWADCGPGLSIAEDTRVGVLSRGLRPCESRERRIYLWFRPLGRAVTKITENGDGGHSIFCRRLAKVKALAVDRFGATAGQGDSARSRSGNWTLSLAPPEDLSMLLGPNFRVGVHGVRSDADNAARGSNRTSCRGEVNQPC